ncbi:2'-5' RNA ligase family protein [Actinomycetospora sp. CA-084318]|uniref:2'-5' RNA ligase family protein n=1 Tax=Actinomycetospora sp. CA-084318 TaxID=3239892 RepID=UPI003D98A439
MRLFVAVFPDDTVNAAVDAALELALRRGPDGGRWRPVARERRHVTLRFHADAEPDEVAAGLRGAPLRAPTLSCAGTGIFGTALWLGVHADDRDTWHTLLRAVGTDPADHVAHLTIARCRGHVPAVPPGLDGHAGPHWTPRAVVLVASGSPYRVLEEFPLVATPGADEVVGGPR